MSKIFSYYKDDLDKAWYNSSNIVYSECDDKENELKTVRIVFKNGATYEYLDVNVNDYLMFRESISQGESFNKYMKKYKFNKLENSNLDEIRNELEKYMNADFIVSYFDGKLTIKKQTEKEPRIEIELGKEEFNKLEMILNTFNELKIKFEKNG